MKRPQCYFGTVAVILGVIALGVAVISTGIFEIPPPWPDRSPPQPQVTREGGKTFKWKNTEITVGGTETVVYPPVPSVSTASKSVFIATAVLALAGIGIGLIATWRERSYVLGGPAVALCSIALLWHYVLIGITVGVAIIVIMMVVLWIIGG